MLAAFGEAWREVYSVPYIVAAKDRAQLGRMLGGLAALGVDPKELPALFRRYVRDPDPFLSEKLRHPLWHFCTGGGLNKYRTTARTAGLSERDIRGALAADEWANGR